MRSLGLIVLSAVLVSLTGLAEAGPWRGIMRGSNEVQSAHPRPGGAQAGPVGAGQREERQLRHAPESENRLSKDDHQRLRRDVRRARSEIYERR